MKPEKPRNHQRAKGKVATSISLSDEALKKARVLAQNDNRSLSNWIENLIERMATTQADGSQDQSNPSTSS
jgi:hypothetical protein